VNSEEKAEEMVGMLKTSQAIGVDLQYHNFHSYLGLTCLLVISTRTADFFVDTLALRTVLRRLLLDVFTDSNIVKVFHGGEQDVLALQRDLGLYVVNMVDIAVAAKFSCVFLCVLYSVMRTWVFIARLTFLLLMVFV